METKIGYTPIDTYYEFQGFRLAEGFYEKFFNFFFVFIIGCSLVYLLAKKDRSMSELLWYLGYIVVVVFLVSPTRTKINVPEYVMDDKALQESLASMGKTEPVMNAPRVMVIFHYMAETITASALDVSRSQWMSVGTRLTPLLRNARLYDSDLAERYRLWLSSCYLFASRPAGSGSAPSNLNPLLVEDPGYATETAANSKGEPLVEGGHPVTCADEWRNLKRLIGNHVNAHATHKETLQEISDTQKFEAKLHRTKTWPNVDAVTYLTNTVVQNETRAYFALTDGRGEIAAVREALGEYSALSGDHTGISIYNDGSFASNMKRTVSWIVMAKQSFDSWFQQNAEVPAMYYKITSYAPFIYGLSMMFILAFFPLAAIASLLPWGWTALVKWAKLLLWIKFWLIGWAIIQDFNSSRMDWSGELAEAHFSKDYDQVWAGLVAMYVATPALAATAIQLLDKGARGVGGMIGSLIPGGSGGGGGYSNQAIGIAQDVGAAVLTGGASEGAVAAGAMAGSGGAVMTSDGAAWAPSRGGSTDVNSGCPANFASAPLPPAPDGAGEV
jgi:hypothetical protein